MDAVDSFSNNCLEDEHFTQIYFRLEN
jgi:hypothetical protein